METRNFIKQTQNIELLNNRVSTVIDSKLKERVTITRFPNRVLRNDLFELLDQFCTVIYYPIFGENNNGFNKTYVINGKEEQFGRTFLFGQK